MRESPAREYSPRTMRDKSTFLAYLLFRLASFLKASNRRRRRSLRRQTDKLGLVGANNNLDDE